jgi:hypothetical protein
MGRRAAWHHPRWFYVNGEYTRALAKEGRSPEQLVDREIGGSAFAGLTLPELIERAVSWTISDASIGTMAGITKTTNFSAAWLTSGVSTHQHDGVARKSTPTELGIIRFPGRIASSVIVEGYAEDGRVREATSRRRN